MVLLTHLFDTKRHRRHPLLSSKLYDDAGRPLWESDVPSIDFRVTPEDELDHAAIALIMERIFGSKNHDYQFRLAAVNGVIDAALVNIRKDEDTYEMTFKVFGASNVRAVSG